MKLTGTAVALTPLFTPLFLLPLCATAEGVSFKQDVVPVLKSRCVVCHLPGGAQAGLVLHPRAAYDALVNKPSTESPLLLVAPGEPDKSYLLHKLMNTHLDVGGSGLQMPFGEIPLTSEEIAPVRQWITEGAANN